MSQVHAATRPHDGALALVHASAILLPAAVSLSYAGGLTRWSGAHAGLELPAIWLAVAVLVALIPFVVTGAFAVVGRQHHRSWTESVQPATPFVVALGVLAIAVTGITTGL